MNNRANPSVQLGTNAGSTKRKMALSVAAALAGLILAAPRSHAEFIFDVTSDGSNVDVTGSGTIDLAGLSYNTTAPDEPSLEPTYGYLVAGPTSSTEGDLYTGFSGPSNFGSGSSFTTGTGMGDEVGIFVSSGNLLVPSGYTSESSLSDSASFTGTFDSLGITPGIYTYTWGSKGAADSLVIDIAPEPSTWAMLLGGAGVLGMTLYRRRACRA